MADRAYAVDGNQNATASDSILGITGATTVRPKIFFITIGSAATPDDQANNMQVNRSTAAGTSTGVTPRPFDQDEAASLCTAGENHSAEPTYTADLVMLSFSFNTRAAYQWYANPGKLLIVPATANNGMGMRFVVATGTQLHEATMHFEE